MTIYPPPPGFGGHESGPWDGFSWYERTCTAEEAELIEAHQAAAEAEEQAELTADAVTQRDAWFASLRAELTGASERSARFSSESERPPDARRGPGAG